MARLAIFLRLTLLCTLASFLLVASASAPARDASYANTVALTDLPAEAQLTLRLIQRGGPFPHSRKDGSTFGNFEGRLPQQVRGYYREYTVPTPDRHDRGARRIIAGAGRTGDVATSGEYYYSDDHYRSFYRIRE